MALRGLADKVFIITGAGSGIGLATAQRLVDEGCQVALVDRDAERLEAAVAAIGANRAHGHVGDAGSPDDIAAYFESSLSRFGRLDGIFNNAGITAPRIQLADVGYDDFERLIRVNILGTFLGIQTMLRHSRETGQPAAIVNTSSGLAVRGAPHHGIYAATKSAIISMTHTAGIEGAELGVRVNAVLPGPTETPTLAAAPPEKKAMYLSSIPMGRLGQTEEIAAAAAWLLSDESSFVTGATLQVDGGQAA